MYTQTVQYDDVFAQALGHGPDGPTYVAPRTRRATSKERVQAWAWYRWGWGQRPGPRHVEPLAPEVVADRPTGRHSVERLGVESDVA